MGLQATFVLYLVIGVGVESALVTRRDDARVPRWFSVLTGILFWPLYVPILLSPPHEMPPTEPGDANSGGSHAAEQSSEQHSGGGDVSNVPAERLHPAEPASKQPSRSA